MAITWEPYTTFPRPSAADIAAYGTATGLDLPSDYADCLMAHAGDVPEPGVVPLRRGATPLGPLYFLDAGRTLPRQSYNAYVAWTNLADWQGLSDPGSGRFVPFATNTSTGIFCFDRTTSPPEVVFVDLGYDLEENGAVQTVAPSFSDLLAKLEP